jgi:plasmid stabilization system protein ParE
MRLRFEAAARLELDAAREYYSRENPELAMSFLDEVRHALRCIGEAPHAWPAHIQGTRRYLLRRFPFYLVYQVRTEDVVIVAVVHNRRDPLYWLPRTDNNQRE